MQRISWCVIAALLVLALLGLFGKGPLSHARASSQSIQVDYERFAHAQNPTTLKVTIRGPTANNAPVSLTINRQYLTEVPAERITPQPLRATAEGENIVFEFASTNSQGMEITFNGSPNAPGFPTAVIGLSGATASTVRFRQLVYP